MSVGAILIIAIAASGALMMRFRKRWLAKINIVFTNRIASLFAGWLPSFGILMHIGRKSGRVYQTPLNVFRAPNGFIIALTNESPVQWTLSGPAARAETDHAKRAMARRAHGQLKEDGDICSTTRMTGDPDVARDPGSGQVSIWKHASGSNLETLSPACSRRCSLNTRSRFR